MQIKDLLLEELAGETAMTRKMLERVPFHEPAWKPHEKSMSIQRLASHIAELPLWFHPILELPELDFLVFRQLESLVQPDARPGAGLFRDASLDGGHCRPDGGGLGRAGGSGPGQPAGCFRCKNTKGNDPVAEYQRRKFAGQLAITSRRTDHL